MRSLGGLFGSQRKDGLPSSPGTALGPATGLAASNFACPQAVKGGRNFSSTAFMPGTPGAPPPGYCIQTPDRSWERARSVAWRSSLEPFSVVSDSLSAVDDLVRP